MTQSNNAVNAVGITLTPGQVAAGKLITQLGGHTHQGMSGPWVSAGLAPGVQPQGIQGIQGSVGDRGTGLEMIWKDAPLKEVPLWGLAYPLEERERLCYGYRPLLPLSSSLVVVKLFPTSEHFVFAMFQKEEVEIFTDATAPTTEEIHALVMFHGKWLTLLKYLEKAKLIEV